MTTGPAEAWRGIAAEDAEEISGRLGTLLRRRSRRLLTTCSARTGGWSSASC